jgi:hypothetical protein
LSTLATTPDMTAIWEAAMRAIARVGNRSTPFASASNRRYGVLQQ